MFETPAASIRYHLIHQREAANQRRLSEHPGVVRLFGVADVGPDKKGLVLELCHSDLRMLMLASQSYIDPFEKRACYHTILLTTTYTKQHVEASHSLTLAYYCCRF